MTTAKNIIDCAKSKIGIPYVHQGRNKWGLDCAGLIINVMQECQVYEGGDIQGYSNTPDGQQLAGILNTYGEKVLLQDIKDGDVLLFTIVNNPQHLAFYFKENDVEYMIHAYGEQSVNKVVYHRFDSKWRNRVCGVFRIKDLVE